MRQYCVGWFYVHYYHLWQTKSTNCLLGFIIWTFNPLSEGSMFVFEIITSSLEPPVTVMRWKTWFVKLLFYFIEWCVIAAVWGVTTNIDNQVTLSRCHAVSRGDTSHNCGHRDGQQCKCVSTRAFKWSDIKRVICKLYELPFRQGRCHQLKKRVASAILQLPPRTRPLPLCTFGHSLKWVISDVGECHCSIFE